MKFHGTCNIKEKHLVRNDINFFLFSENAVFFILHQKSVINFEKAIQYIQIILFGS